MTERLVKLCIAPSMDGYISGPKGEIDWLGDPGEVGLDDFFASVDTVLIGRKTYDWTKEMGHGAATPGKKTYVFTRSQDVPEDPDVEFVSTDVVEFVGELRQQPGKHIWLMGGGELIASLLDANLVDEMILGIHPIVLGDGVPLFPGSRPERIGYELVSSEAFASGIIMATYRRKSAD
ncbi:MAG: dihydrofolate reductase family protein [Planctomycetota bacterium]|nr:dihydrofolate reductase family protein [Planctomycetota bacterium]